MGDVRDADGVHRALDRVDVVYHAAGVAGLWGPREYYHSVNVRGTQNVMAACRRRGVGRLVYTSSPSVVFTDGDQCGADESLPYTQRAGCATIRTAKRWPSNSCWPPTTCAVCEPAHYGRI